MATNPKSRTFKRLVDRKIEPNVITQFCLDLDGRFNELVRNGAVSNQYVSSSLGSQDHKLADYLLEANGRFCLVEFKADEKSIKSEAAKPLRQKLSAQYLARRDLLDMGKQIHYIAWGDERPLTIPHPVVDTIASVTFDRYPYRLCAALDPKFPKRHSKILDSDEFIEAFMGSQLVGSAPVRFKRYVEALYKIAGKNSDTELANLAGAVFIYLPESQRTVSVPFKGIERLYALTIGFDKYQREATLGRRPDSPRLR